MSGSISSRFALLVSKFRGCLVGSLVGDCMGALAEVQQLFTPASMTAAADTHLPANSMSSMTNSQDAHLSSSQQTRIMHSIANSLLHSEEFNRSDLINRLTQGSAAENRFSSFRSPNQRNALEHLDFSNGPLQTIPFALYFYGDCAKTVEAAKEYTNLWHSGPDDKIMSVLYCLATHMALQFDPIQPLNTDVYLDRLISAMAEVEAGNERTNRLGLVMINKDKPSLRKLEIIRETMRSNSGFEKAVTKLNDVAPEHTSVSIAILNFLQAQQLQKDSPKKNPIELGLQGVSATSNNGQVLASLSCGLIGAFHGIEAVPMNMRKQCKGLQETIKLGDNLAAKFECRPSGFVERKEITFVQRL